MWIRSASFAIVLQLIFALSFSASVDAQALGRVALKSGESADLGLVYWVSHCKSIMIGLPTVDILDGPPEITITIRTEMVLPRLQNCPNKVAGGTIVARASTIAEPAQTQITYRVNYKTKEGDRPRSYVYNLSLFP
jgi:hypothetical protein